MFKRHPMLALEYTELYRISFPMASGYVCGKKRQAKITAKCHVKNATLKNN